MNKYAENRFNRAFSGIMAVMMLVVVLFSAMFIVSHADHDCTGEDCPICACIQQCENILHGTAGGSLLAAAALIPIVLISGSVLFSYCFIIFQTPVLAKVRMNN